MKKLTKIAGLALFSLSIAGTAHAAEVKVNATATATSTPVKERVEARKEIQKDFRDAVKEKKDDIRALASTTKSDMKAEIEARKENLKSKVSERLTRALVHAKDRLSDATDRLDQIRAKIVSRLTKIDANGGSTVEARVQLGKADALLVTAKADIAALANITVSETNASSTLAVIKAATRKAEGSLKAARDAYLKVIPSIKGQVSATSTASVNK